MPTASTTMAVTVNPGVLASERSAKRRSRQVSSVQAPGVKATKNQTAEKGRIIGASRLSLGHYQKGPPTPNQRMPRRPVVRRSSEWERRHAKTLRIGLVQIEEKC